MVYENTKDRSLVYGIFPDQDSLDRAINILKSQNFINTDISILMHSKKATIDFAFEKHTKAPEGATTGAATGAIAGGIFGWLIGIGTLAIPGFGPFIAAGPIMASIAGAGMGGTVGGVAGGLIGLGIPEFEALRYESYIRDGGLLISVYVDNPKWETRAKEIFEENGALSIATTSENKFYEKIPGPEEQFIL